MGTSYAFYRDGCFLGEVLQVKTRSTLVESHMFGDIFQWVRDAEDRVVETKAIYDRDPMSEHREILHQAQAELNRTLSIEEGFWKQKASAHWVCEGDHNTRYFHAIL